MVQAFESPSIFEAARTSSVGLGDPCVFDRRNGVQRETRS